MITTEGSRICIVSLINYTMSCSSRLMSLGFRAFSSTCFLKENKIYIYISCSSRLRSSGGNVLVNLQPTRLMTSLSRHFCDQTLLRPDIALFKHCCAQTLVHPGADESRRCGVWSTGSNRHHFLTAIGELGELKTQLRPITGFDAEACWPLNGPLFSPLNPLYFHCVLSWG